MIADLKPYAEYKESGLPWLGQVPSHWEVRRLKHLARFQSGDGITSLDIEPEGPFPVYGGNGLRGYTNRYTHDGHYALIGRQGALCGNINYAFGKFFASEHAVVCTLFTGVSVVWFGELLRTMDLNQFSQSAAQPGLAVERIQNLYAPVAVPSEQAAIVRFLDWANGRLERAIRAKRKVIALLNEQKRAIIHRAVTRGLDPSVPLKPSGIPWLGDIPQHWEVRRVKQATRILRGKFSHRPRNDASLYDGRYPFIQTGVVAQAPKFITSYSQTLNEKGLAVSKLFPTGTLVMTIAANIGEVAVLTFDACFPDSIVGFVPSASADRDYLYMVFLCMKPELLREAPVNTQGNLNVERIGAMEMPFPPLGEQRQIAKRAEVETKSFDSATARLEREIDLLREYRTRLVADVVTGKLEVREAVTRLPDEPSLGNSDGDPDLTDEAAEA